MQSCGDPVMPASLRAPAFDVVWLTIVAVALMSLVLLRGPLPVAAPGVVAPAAAAPAANAAPRQAVPPGAAPGPVAPALGQAQRTGKAVLVAFTLSEQELTAAAARSFSQTIAGMTLSDPVIHLAAGSAQLVATTKLLFVTTQLAVSTTPSVAGGRVVARLDSATMGGVGLPDAARGSIVAAVESAIAQVLRAKLQVTGVTVSAGVITFQGIAQP